MSVQIAFSFFFQFFVPVHDPGALLQSKTTVIFPNAKSDAISEHLAGSIHDTPS